MTPAFLRRIEKAEASLPDAKGASGRRVVFLRPPEHLTGLDEQERWANDQPREAGDLVVLFVRYPPPGVIGAVLH